MTEAGEVDPIAIDRDAFGAKAKALLEAVFAGEENFSPGAEHAMPGDVFSPGPQRPDDLASRAGISGGRGDIPVGRDFAARDTADLVEDALEHQLVLNFSSIST